MLANHVRERQAWTAHLLFWFLYALAQFREQFDELIFLASLRLIVSGPFLLVGLAHRNRLGDSFGVGLFVKIELALNHKLDGPNVFAFDVASLVIWTGAMRVRNVGCYGVARAVLACIKPDWEGTNHLSPLRSIRALAAISSPRCSLALSIVDLHSWKDTARARIISVA